MKVFLSHSSLEKEKAEALCEWLEARDIKCFLAPRDIPAGAEYAEEIVNGIDSSDAMVLLLSENANKSPHVLREVERAVSKSIPILIYSLEKVVLSKSMEYFLMTHQWVSSKSQNGYDEIWEFVERIGQGQEEQAVIKKPTGQMVQKNSHKVQLGIIVACLVVLAALLVLPLLKEDMQNSNPSTNTGDRNETKIYAAQPGDTVTFGSYNEEAIEWRVLKVEEDTESVMLVAKNILTMKAMDAPESGIYNGDGKEDYWKSNSLAETDLELEAFVRGSNDWSSSNIRTWLNSDTEVVKYEGQAPVASAMSEKKNGYQNEAGFLHGFTKEEQALMKVNAVGDKVSLLTKEDIALFEAAGISLYAEPTQAALEQDKTEWYEYYQSETDMKTYSYWLKDAVEGTSSQYYLISGGYTEEVFETASAGLEGYGIRPVIVVELHSDIFMK